jgi:hypothetical protein
MFNSPNRLYSNGISWGMKGFRVGRNQSGIWWFSFYLPFGFRYSKSLGKLQNRNITKKNIN